MPRSPHEKASGLPPGATAILVALALALSVALIDLARAQGSPDGAAPRPAPPQQPNPTQTIPERIAPQPLPRTTPGQPGATLSDQLRASDGVLSPAPTPSDMPVIDPPAGARTPVIVPPPAGQAGEAPRIERP